MSRNYIEDLKTTLASNLNDEEKKNLILQYHESDIADMLEELDKPERKELFRILGKDQIAEVLTYVEHIDEFLDDMTSDEAADFIEKMDSDDAVDVLDELDDDKKQEIVALLDKDIREDIEEINKYDEDEIGSRMTNNFIVINNDDTIKSAMKKLLAQAENNDNVNDIFVLKDNLYYGVIELRDLIIARSEDDINKIIKTNYPYFLATDEIDDVIGKLKEYALDSYPVLNDKKELIGIITSDDVVEAVDDEIGDDYAKLAGLTAEEEKDSSTMVAVKKRIPWLIALCFLGLVQATAMTGFEHVVAAIPIIVFFQTLISDMAGNSGTQSLAVTIRRLSIGEIKFKDLLRNLFKQILVGFGNGLIIAMLAFGLVLLFLKTTNQSVNPNTDFEINDALKCSSIISISLLCAMTLSTFVGTLVPIIFYKLRLDPAVASGPFITTINDVTSILIYYGLASLMFQALL